MCALTVCMAGYMPECYIVCLLCMWAVGGAYDTCRLRVRMSRVLYSICSANVLTVSFLPCLCHVYAFILDGVHAVCELYALSCGACIL